MRGSHEQLIVVGKQVVTDELHNGQVSNYCNLLRAFPHTVIETHECRSNKDPHFKASCKFTVEFWSSGLDRRSESDML